MLRPTLGNEDRHNFLLHALMIINRTSMCVSGEWSSSNRSIKDKILLFRRGFNYGEHVIKTDEARHNSVRVND